MSEEGALRIAAAAVGTDVSAPSLNELELSNLVVIQEKEQLR